MNFSEEWKSITDKIIPGIQPWYVISNTGRVWSTYSDKEIKPFQYEKTGYWHLGLRMQDGSSKHFMIHRLVMMVFNPFPDMYLYEVNHIDGNKSNNCLYNLEWSTRLDNITHAWENNLYKSGEDHHNALLTNEQVHLICQGLEKHLPYKEIAKNINLEFSAALSSCMSDIKAGRRWLEISSQYNFNDQRSYQLFTNDEIHYICKCLESGKSTDDILNLFNVTDPDDVLKKRRCINSIRRRDKFKNISKDYIF